LRLDVGVQDPHLAAGDENAVNVTLGNIGQEPVYDVDASITSTSPYIALLQGAQFNCDLLDTNATVAFQATVAVSRSAPLGVYTLTASISYRDGDGESHRETFTLGVNVDSVKVEEETIVVLRGFDVAPEIVRPGDALDLKLELACVGAEAHDVETLLSFDPGSSVSPLSPTLVALGDLEPSQTAEARYRLLVDGEAAAGQYAVRVTMSYLDSRGVPRSAVEVVTLSVRGIVSFRLMNAQEVVVEQGGVADVEADLLLIGTESVDFVQIGVVEDGRFEGTWRGPEYIGPVDPDSPVPFNIQFSVADGVAPGAYPLLLNVTYFDDLNRVRGSVVELPVSVVKAEVVVEVRKPMGGFWLWLRRLFGIVP